MGSAVGGRAAAATAAATAAAETVVVAVEAARAAGERDCLTDPQARLRQVGHVGLPRDSTELPTNTSGHASGTFAVPSMAVFISSSLTSPPGKGEATWAR